MEHEYSVGRSGGWAGSRNPRMRVIVCVWLMCVVLLSGGPVWAQEPPPKVNKVLSDDDVLSDTPPPWWYDPDKPERLYQVPPLLDPPEWWYVPQQSMTTLAFTTLDITVDVESGQSLNAGVIPVNVHVEADGTTPEIVVQVTSDEVPNQAVFAGHEKIPEGAVQNLYGFQQARFIGGVGNDGIADITFKYEALTSGWVNFTVKVYVGGNLLRGPETHAVYVADVPATFTTLTPAVTVGNNQCLNAGAFPLTVQLDADGTTPEIIVQVVSEEVPDKAIYMDVEKRPDGTIQNLYGFQQARFSGGVGADNTAEITFWYEPLVTGWVNFTVKVWVGDNLWYGPVNHAVYVCEVSPSFTSLNTNVSLPASQGLNAGVIPLNIKVTADGKTPPIEIHVVSEEVPDRAVHVGAEKSPHGAIQNLYGYQQARFSGGVGPDGVAEVTLKYEALTVGWVNFTVKVWIGGNLWYGPVRYSIYMREAGPPGTICPPLIYNFAVASQDDNHTTFEVEAIGNPTPQYDLNCGTTYAEASADDLTCVYEKTGTYVARLRATNDFESGTEYSDVATATVTVGDIKLPPDFVLPTFTWTGVVTWTGIVTRLNDAGDVISMPVTLLEPVAIPTGTLPITVTYTTLMATRERVYAQGGAVMDMPGAGAVWRAQAQNWGGTTSAQIYAGSIQPFLYLPLMLRHIR